MTRRASVVVALLVALAGCGGGEPSPVVETVASGPVLLAVHGEGEVKSSRATPLKVPGSQWAGRRLAWALPEGTAVRRGELVARFTADQARLELAQATIDLERNALARAGKAGELDIGRGRVAVDLAQVGVELGIAHRYADAQLDTIARNEVLDAVQDVRYLGEKRGALQWKQGQFGRRGGAELAVLDAQRATYAINAKRRQDDLDALELRAPHDGVLMLAANWTGDKPQVGSSLHAGAEFGSLPDTSAMEVELSLPQLEAQGVKAGDVIELAPVGRPGEVVTSTLAWVASAAKVRSRQSPVKYLSMKAPIPSAAVHRLGLVPGQRMRARVVLLRAAQAISVANVAIESDDGRSYVQVSRDGVIERREIGLGVRGPARSQVLSGLRAGEQVVLARPADTPGDAGARVDDGAAAPGGDA